MAILTILMALRPLVKYPPNLHHRHRIILQMGFLSECLGVSFNDLLSFFMESIGSLRS